MRTKIDLKNLAAFGLENQKDYEILPAVWIDWGDMDYCLPAWLLNDRANDDHVYWRFWLARHYPRTYKSKVVTADFFSIESEITELFAILGTHGIEFRLVGHTPDIFAIVMWRPEDWAIAREFVREQSSIPYEYDESDGSRTLTKDRWFGSL
jgi:hypothetical protein